MSKRTRDDSVEESKDTTLNYTLIAIMIGEDGEFKNYVLPSSRLGEPLAKAIKQFCKTELASHFSWVEEEHGCPAISYLYYRIQKVYWDDSEYENLMETFKKVDPSLTIEDVKNQEADLAVKDKRYQHAMAYDGTGEDVIVLSSTNFM